MSDNSFGWVEIKGDLVIAHVLDKDGENETHKFENEEIIKAVKFYKNMKGLVDGYAESPEITIHSIGRKVLSEF